MSPAGETTLKDLMLILAERTGQTVPTSASDSTPVVTSDPGIRDRILRCINQGRAEAYRRLSEARCFTPRLSITLSADATGSNVVASDASKYRLPFGVHGLATGRWTWRQADSAGNGGILTQRHETDLAAMHYANPTTGAPMAMALVAQALTGSTEPGRRIASYLWLYPTPSLDYIIEGQARVSFEPMTSPSDLEPMGQEHTNTILALATREWSIGRVDAAEWAQIEATCEQAIAISRDLDNQRGPSDIGPGRDPDAERDGVKYLAGGSYYQSSNMVTHVGGVDVIN